MTEERIKEYIQECLRGLMGKNCLETGASALARAEIEQTVRTVAAESRKEGIEAMLDAFIKRTPSVKDLWVRELAIAIAERLKKQG